MLLPKPELTIPQHTNILPYLNDWSSPNINEVLPQINDTHKSTEANEKIVNNIVKYMPKNLEM